MSRKYPGPDVTLITDASYRLKEQDVAGWGCWAKGDNRQSIQGGGAIAEFPPSTMAAEICAIANGLALLVSSGYFVKTDKRILLQSDSVMALQALRMVRGSIAVNNHKDSARIGVRKKPLDDISAAEINKILTICDERNLLIQIRHVRGHQQNTNGRSWVNNLCDRLAKDGARQLLIKQLGTA